jgi:hypothetical protein
MAARAGRKPQGWKLIDELPGRSDDKRKMKIFLQTLTGTCTVEDACRQLELRPSWFFDVRKRWLQDSFNAVAARPLGRPPRTPPEVRARLVELEQQVRDLQRQLAAAELRCSLAQIRGEPATSGARTGSRKKRRRGRPLTLPAKSEGRRLRRPRQSSRRTPPSPSPRGRLRPGPNSRPHVRMRDRPACNRPSAAQRGSLPRMTLAALSTCVGCRPIAAGGRGPTPRRESRNGIDGATCCCGLRQPGRGDSRCGSRRGARASLAARGVTGGSGSKTDNLSSPCGAVRRLVPRQPSARGRCGSLRSTAPSFR